MNVENLDWNTHFYSILKGYKKSQSLDVNLEEFFDNSDWFDQIARKDNLFFNFVRYLMRILESMRTLNEINRWEYFYGYNRLIQSFLINLK